MEQYVLFVFASVLAGLTWTMSGYLVDWRKNHSNPEWIGFEPKKLRNDLILGVVLGVILVVVQPILEGATGESVTIPEVIDAPTFFAAIFILYGPVAMIDKFLIGFVAKK